MTAMSGRHDGELQSFTSYGVVLLHLSGRGLRIYNGVVANMVSESEVLSWQPLTESAIVITLHSGR